MFAERKYLHTEYTPNDKIKMQALNQFTIISLSNRIQLQNGRLHVFAAEIKNADTEYSKQKLVFHISSLRVHNEFLASQSIVKTFVCHEVVRKRPGVVCQKFAAWTKRQIHYCDTGKHVRLSSMHTK